MAIPGSMLRSFSSGVQKSCAHALTCQPIKSVTIVKVNLLFTYKNYTPLHHLVKLQSIFEVGILKKIKGTPNIVKGFVATHRI